MVATPPVEADEEGAAKRALVRERFAPALQPGLDGCTRAETIPTFVVSSRRWIDEWSTRGIWRWLSSRARWWCSFASIAAVGRWICESRVRVVIAHSIEKS
jgi:hypothetical protein